MRVAGFAMGLLIIAVVASAGAAWLAWRAVPGLWRRLGPRGARAWDVGLALLGLAGALCWSNLGQFNFPGFGHPSETFHYYLGAKYFPELGYTRLTKGSFVDRVSPDRNGTSDYFYAATTVSF